MKIARFAAIVGIAVGGALGLSAASASAAPFGAGAAPFAAAMDHVEQAQYGPPPGYYRRRGPPPRRYDPRPRRYQPRLICETRWERVRTPWGWERRPRQVCFRR
ncbi:MAG TPA: hypothetical protein VM434_20855 [Beijerinckiaceae bacterium]|nr:hypothetical protein [Beijerinckiaceae bacterium]